MRGGLLTMRDSLIWRKCIFEDVYVTQSSENGSGACLVFLMGFQGKSVLSRGRVLRTAAGWWEGGPATPVFGYNPGQAQGAPWTALSLCRAPPLATSGPGGLQGAGGAGCPAQAVGGD